MSAKNVLIVDDDEEWAADIIGFELQEMGYGVRIASDLRSARQALNEQVFALVTVDMCLEEGRDMFEGEFVLEHVKGKCPHIPCIVISGSPCPPEVIFGLSRQYPMIPDDGYLCKTQFNLRRFKDLVDRLLHIQQDAGFSEGGAEGTRAEAGVQEAAAERRRQSGYLVELRRILVRRFDEDELRTLCFDLRNLCLDPDLEYDSLPGKGKAGKARELVDYLQRHDLIPELVKICKELRPEITWGDVPSAHQEM
jgi:CheY-like chemotaxis protein